MIQKLLSNTLIECFYQRFYTMLIKILKNTVSTVFDDMIADMHSKIGKYEYLTGEKILSSDKGRIIEQAKCAYSPLCKAFKKKQKKQLKNKEKNKLNFQKF